MKRSNYYQIDYFLDKSPFEGPFTYFPDSLIVIDNSLSLDLDGLFPSTSEGVIGCVDGFLSDIPLNRPVFLVFGDPRHTVKPVVATGIVHIIDSSGSKHPYLRVVDPSGVNLYFQVRLYDPKTRWGVLRVRPLTSSELEFLGLKE